MNFIYNVKIYTMDNTFSVADAMVWEKGRILAVGSKDELAKEFQAENMIDGGGLVVLPGFIDPHIHFFDGAMFHFIRGVNVDSAGVD